MEYILEVIKEGWWIILLIGGLFTVLAMAIAPEEEYEPLDKHYNHEEDHITE